MIRDCDMDLMNLAARLTLDMKDYENGIGKASQSAQSFSKKFGGALKTVAKFSAAAIGAGAVAIGMLTKQSVSAYAEYEQLAGGVKKLFGSAAEDVMKFANEAYKTSGMSANQYMEQATSFSAAMINSLGGDTKKAAKQVDVAMQAMSDNVNTFGTDMASVQYAFQGFAKQNYTMLDNLKLGYGGTKTEMERLIADANEYAAANGKAADLSIESFSDIVTAIELIQEKQGIAGTTAKEAATTIEGAFNMTKAAWSNLVAGLANPDADMDHLMDNLIVALVGDKQGTGLLNNLMPAIQRALQGIGMLVSKAAPVISKNLPALFGSLLPSVISAATSLVVSLAKALPGIAKVIVAQIPMIAGMLLGAFRDMGGEFVSMGSELMNYVFNGINNKAPQLGAALSSLGETFQNVVDKMKQFWDEHGSQILTKAGEIFNGIKNFVITALTFVTTFIDGFIQTALALWDEFGGSIMGYLSALKDFWIAVFQAIAEDVTNFITNIKAFWAEWGDEIMAVTKVVWDTVSTIINTVIQVITGIVQAFTALISGDWEGFLEAIQKVTDTIFKGIQKVISIVLNAIKSVVISVWNAVKTKITTTLNNIKTAISNAFNTAKTTVSNAMNNVKSTISDAWENAKKTVSNAVENIRSSIQEKFQAAYDKVSGIFGDIHDKIKDKMDAAKELVEKAVKKIKDVFPIKLGKIFKGVKLPHFKIKGGEIPWGIGGKGTKPSVDIEWYKKAYANPYLFTESTVLTGMGFGDGSGAEMVYGHENLMKDIKAAMLEVAGYNSGIFQNITINSPTQLNPSEVARQTRNSTRAMLMKMRTV